MDSPENVARRPPRYRHLILPADWFVVGSKYTGKGDPDSYRRDRKHRKTHGVITFVELTKLVASKWKEADPETKDYCRNIALGESKRYRKELDEFIKIYGVDAARGKKRRPRKSKTTQEVVPEMEDEQQMKEGSEAELISGECAFIPVDDDLIDDIVRIYPVQSGKKKADMLSEVTEADFSLYAPSRLNGRTNTMISVDNSKLQDQAAYYRNQRVLLQDFMSRSLSLPFGDINGYGGNPFMMTPTVGDVSNFQGLAVHRSLSMPSHWYGNDQGFVGNFGNEGFSQAFGQNTRFGELGFHQGPVTGAASDQFARQYKNDISRDMTQQRALELQRQLHSQQQYQQQRQNVEIQACVERLYLLQFHRKCLIKRMRVGKDNSKRSSTDMSMKRNVDRNRRGSMDTASSRSNMIHNSFRRSSLPNSQSKTFQEASTEFPQLSLKQELIIKSLVEQERHRKSLHQSPTSNPSSLSLSKRSSQEWGACGKMPLAHNPTTNCPSAA